jgi:hypothetical protein
MFDVVCLLPGSSQFVFLLTVNPLFVLPCPLSSALVVECRRSFQILGQSTALISGDSLLPRRDQNGRRPAPEPRTRKRGNQIEQQKKRNHPNGKMTSKLASA